MAINPLFAFHKLNDTGKDKAQRIAEEFSLLLENLNAIGCGEGREMALVKTKLEEASFFAKKAMATKVENQDLSRL